MGDDNNASSVGNITPGIYESMMKNYFEHTRYVKRVSYSIKDDNPNLHGDFEITESCYCKNVDHFTGAEFMLCSTQLGYLLFSEAIERGDVPELGMKSYEDLNRRRPSNILITGCDKLKFRGLIDSKSFGGDAHINRRRVVRGSVFYQLGVFFSDSNGGRASGLLDVVAVK